jgi:hypothetical protein
MCLSIDIDAFSMAGSMSGTGMPCAAPAAAIMLFSSSGLIFSNMSAAAAIIDGSMSAGLIPGGSPGGAPTAAAAAAALPLLLAPAPPLPAVAAAMRVICAIWSGDIALTCSAMVRAISGVMPGAPPPAVAAMEATSSGDIEDIISAAMRSISGFSAAILGRGGGAKNAGREWSWWLPPPAERGGSTRGPCITPPPALPAPHRHGMSDRRPLCGPLRRRSCPRPLASPPPTGPPPTHLRHPGHVAARRRARHRRRRARDALAALRCRRRALAGRPLRRRDDLLDRLVLDHAVLLLVPALPLRARRPPARRPRRRRGREARLCRLELLADGLLLLGVGPGGAQRGLEVGHGAGQAAELQECLAAAVERLEAGGVIWGAGAGAAEGRTPGEGRRGCLEGMLGWAECTPNRGGTGGGRQQP